ncbi:hypothetical protein CH373_17350 [Leptospira perolatii]|uniref:Uncharacterized protein n=1 Tax=Leptospira perolatii TaxID=2023191 RepID=A0A2M9ZID8_9LEPT|nr:hypothetical protein [Leptospira perolatii]PJZ68331.1 hypothetical protein CH360_16635 [Leptospira perolatii]PJZ71819.1 hypothetical protein CH373_17350 [Leptospira perolatii]
MPDWELPFTLSLHEGILEPHIDLFLDPGGISRLITFGTYVSGWELLQKGEEVTLLRKDDHRRIYMNYEGVIEGKGSIRILIRGTAKINASPESLSERTELRATLRDGLLHL